MHKQLLLTRKFLRYNSFSETSDASLAGRIVFRTIIETMLVKFEHSITFGSVFISDLTTNNQLDFDCSQTQVGRGNIFCIAF